LGAGECVVDRAVVDELLTRRRRTDPLDALTPREREILALMADGRSNQSICRALRLRPKTVGIHIKGAFAKLGIRRNRGLIVPLYSARVPSVDAGDQCT
jgi:DNA-binding CsgD family transcriptional regulator